MRIRKGPDPKKRNCERPNEIDPQRLFVRQLGADVGLLGLGGFLLGLVPNLLASRGSNRTAMPRFTAASRSGPKARAFSQL
jgi:hypothetical protein